MPRYIFVILLAVYSICACSSSPPVKQLILIQALPVDDAIEPSGLTLYNGVFYTISDKTDSVIYRIEVDADSARMVPHLTFLNPRLASGVGLDFEGIDCDENGNFYLASEKAYGVLFVSADGDSVTWFTQRLQKAGELQGLFKTPNANLECITWVDPTKLLVGAERQPRGLIEVDVTETPFTYNVFNYDHSSVPVPEGRKMDFTGLYAEGGNTYSLNRNANVITRISYGEPTLVEHEVWSFADIVNSEALRYQNMDFGMAEGVAMDQERVYVVLDNNGIARTSDPGDVRPLFLIMERPAD